MYKINSFIYRIDDTLDYQIEKQIFYTNRNNFLERIRLLV